MVIAKDVKGPDGGVAIAAQTPVTPDVIETLDTLGAGFVFIDPENLEVSEEILARRVEAHVRRFFQYVDPDLSAFDELFRLTLERTWQAAHQDWELPCESEMTAQHVEHLRDLFFKGRADVHALIKHEVSLGSFPDIYVRIKEVLESPTSSAEDIARVIATDPGMSAKLLKLVNSPLFGFATKIESVPHAVSLAGTKEISTLALGISAINYFRDIPPELISLKMFWRHCISCAVFAKLIAAELDLPSDRFFTAGLLHDVGRLIMYKNMPYASVQSLFFARGNSFPLVEAEREVLDFDHAQVADLLLKQWEFPDHLRALIAHHHSPMSADDTRAAAVVQLADNMANAMAVSADGMYVLPGMPAEAWETLGLDPSQMEEMIKMHDRSVDAITSAFV